MATDQTKQAYYIDAKVSVVFNSLSNSQTLAKWFLKSATLERKKGGKYSFAWLGVDFKQDGSILDFKENEKLTIEWPSAGEESIVTFITKKEGTGTMLTMVQSGYKDDKRKLMTAKAEQLVDFLYKILDTIDKFSVDDGTSIMKTALDFKLSFYDAAYVQYSKATNLTLVTEDGKLEKKIGEYIKVSSVERVLKA